VVVKFMATMIPKVIKLSMMKVTMLRELHEVCKGKTGDM
jgi:hypothetical protein